MNLFAYGTLMSPRIIHSVIGSIPVSEPGLLNGHSRKALKHQVYPALMVEEHGQVDGLVYFGLTSADISRLDYFEGELYTARSVEVLCSGKPVICFTYLLKDAYHHVLSDQDWDYENFLALHSGQFTRDFRGS